MNIEIIIQTLQEIHGSLKETKKIWTNLGNVTTDDLSSFKYKSSFIKPLTIAHNGVFKDVKIAVPLKYLSSFWRSLATSLINCKIHLELNWTKDCVMSTIADTTFKITNNKLYVPFVTLQAKTM